MAALCALAAFAACQTMSSPSVPGNGPIVTITSSGVSPKTLVVSPGTQITFVNNDSRSHEMTSDPHPTHEDCPELNQVGFLSPGQSRQSGNLNAVGTCGFHDHLNNTNQALSGTVTIQ